MNLILSVGHNWAKSGSGIDKGASGNGTNEATVTNLIIEAIIKKGIPGVTITKVPLGLSLIERINWINKLIPKVKEPFAMELHLDSAGPTAQGCSIRYNDDNAYTKGEGGQFLMEYTRITGLKSRGVNSDKKNRLGDLGFVSQIKCASLLLECGFISNATELKTIRAKAVEGIIGGIQNMIKK